MGKWWKCPCALTHGFCSVHCFFPPSFSYSSGSSFKCFFFLCSFFFFLVCAIYIKKFKSPCTIFLIKKSVLLFCFIKWGCNCKFISTSFSHPLIFLLNQTNNNMFGNCFFPLFSIFKNYFLFFRLKNLFGNPKWT